MYSATACVSFVAAKAPARRATTSRSGGRPVYFALDRDSSDIIQSAGKIAQQI